MDLEKIDKDITISPRLVTDAKRIIEEERRKASLSEKKCNFAVNFG